MAPTPPRRINRVFVFRAILVSVLSVCILIMFWMNIGGSIRWISLITILVLIWLPDRYFTFTLGNRR